MLGLFIFLSSLFSTDGLKVGKDDFWLFLRVSESATKGFLFLLALPWFSYAAIRMLEQGLQIWRSMLFCFLLFFFQTSNFNVRYNADFALSLEISICGDGHGFVVCFFL